MQRVVEFRITSVLLVVGGFLAGLAGGLHGFHAFLEADAPLAELAAKRADPAALRAEHGDAFVVHGRVEDKRVESERDATGTRLRYVVEVTDSTATVAFEVRRASYERVRDGEWTRVPLAYDAAAGDFVAGALKAAVQPWQYAAAYATSVAFLVGGGAWRIARSGASLERDGDVVRVQVPRR